MVSDVMARIDRRLKKLNKSRRGASLAAGLNAEYLRNLAEEGSSPTLRALEKLSLVLETPIPWLAEESGPEDIEQVAEAEGTIPVWGDAGAGGKIERFHVEDGPIDRIPAPPGSGPRTAAVHIRGESLGRLFDKWYAIYDEVRDPPTDDLEGELCVCETADHVVYVKKLKKYRGKRWTLESNFDAPIPNVVILWAAKVKSLVPR